MLVNKTPRVTVRFRKYKHKIYVDNHRNPNVDKIQRQATLKELYSTEENSEEYGAQKMELSGYDSLLNKQ